MSAPRCEFYQVLGISRSASPGAVRRAYRQRALATHPDKGGSAEAFRQVVLAFETLGSAVERGKYDNSASQTIESNQGEVSKPGPSASSHTSSAASTRAWQQQASVSTPSDDVGPVGKGRRTTMPASQLPRKRRQVGPNEYLFTALEQLRTLLFEVDRELRMEWLSTLCKSVKAALLAHMLRATSPMCSTLSLGIGIDKHVTQQAGFSFDSSSDDGCDAVIDPEDANGESTDDSETPSVLCIKDGRDIDHANTEILAWDESCPNNWLALENAALECERECRELVPGAVGAINHNSSFRGLGKSGVCGISTWIDERYAGKSQCVYRAKISIQGLFILSRTRGTLDAAISDHMALVHLRDALCAILERHHSSLGDCPEHVVREILDCEQKIRLEYVEQDEFLFTYFTMISAYSLIGRQLFTPHTRDIRVCMEHLQTLKRAKCQGWEALRSAWVMVSLHVEPRIPGGRGNTNRTAEQMFAFIDAAYERHAPVRGRRHERKERRAKRIEEQARQQHQLCIARNKRRFARIAVHAERALRADEDATRRLQQQRNTRLQQQRMAEEREENRRKRAASQLLRKWERQDLTMEEIMRGPPDFST